MKMSKPDIVYFVKESRVNPELTYSLRSVVENFRAGGRVVFYGGCPDNLQPDKHVAVKRDFGIRKWYRVRHVMLEACNDDDLTEDFWLFNDDFFVLRPVETMEPTYTKTIEYTVEKMVARDGFANEYAKRMTHCADTLRSAGCDTLNYAVHKPMLVNRKKMREVLEKFPKEPMLRALYGNYWRVGGRFDRDCKIRGMTLGRYNESLDFVSTDDASFAEGDIGKLLRELFDRPCKYETHTVY